MTRHITDRSNRPVKVGHADDLVRLRRRLAHVSGPSKTLNRPRPSGNGRLVQYLMIERGRSV